jgi:hypothetical protein
VSIRPHGRPVTDTAGQTASRPAKTTSVGIIWMPARLTSHHGTPAGRCSRNCTYRQSSWLRPRHETAQLAVSRIAQTRISSSTAHCRPVTAPRSPPVLHTTQPIAITGGATLQYGS